MSSCAQSPVRIESYNRADCLVFCVSVRNEVFTTHGSLSPAHIIEVTVSITDHILTTLALSFLADRSIKPLCFTASRARASLCSLLSDLLTLTGVHQGTVRFISRSISIGLGLADGGSVSDECLRLGELLRISQPVSNLSGFDARNGGTGVAVNVVCSHSSISML